MNKDQISAQHVAIIMDGNRRYAQKMGWPSLKGHEAGFQNFKELVRVGRKMGLKAMTFYCFSTENWNRSKTEVNYLMRLLHSSIVQYVDELQKNQIQLVHLGRKDRLPKRLIALLQNASEKTAYQSEMILNLAIDYGSRDELLRAFSALAQDTPSEEWTEELVEAHLDTHLSPPLDIFIRTSGEYRVSNFLLWQASYSEFFFEDLLFPEFTSDHLCHVLERFEKRNRRFGT